jgi:hypothetical protein
MLIIFFIVYPIYLDISIEGDVNLIAAIVTYPGFPFLDKKYPEHNIRTPAIISLATIGKKGFFSSSLVNTEFSVTPVVMVSHSPKSAFRTLKRIFPKKCVAKRNIANTVIHTKTVMQAAPI